jgi:hypothetical protein
MTKYIDGVRAALEEMAQKKEGNAFTKALMAAREKGDATFTIAGKSYKCEDYDEEGNVKEAKEITYRVGDKKQNGNMGAKNLKDLMAKLKAAKFDMKSLEIYDRDARKQIMRKGQMVEDTEEATEAMDPVNPKAAKKDFKDRKDKDIDNDGDVDSSDEYLHKKRKAISKSKGKNEDEPEGDNGETATMNPKKESKVNKESTIRDRLLSIWEDAAGAKRTAGATPPENVDGGKDGKSPRKDMRNAHSAEKKGEAGKEADDSDAAEKSTKPAAMRGNDNNMGDRQIINKIANAYKTLQKGKDA